MDLRQLELAVAVAEQGTFSRAAEAVHLSQPALSYAIAKLEAEFGVELFHRGGRAVVTTAVGQVFLAGARETLRQAERLRASMAEISGVVSGRLEVVAPRTLVRRMAGYVGAFRGLYPGVVVQVEDAEGDDAVLEALRSGRCELGLLRSTVLPAGITADRLAPQEFVAVFPGSVNLPERRSITLAQLAVHPLVAPPRGSPNRLAFDHLFAAAGLTVTVVAETAHPESILEMVGAGAGASLASREEADSFVVSRRIQPRRFKPPLAQPVYLARRQATRLSPAESAFRELTIGAASLDTDRLPSATRSGARRTRGAAPRS